MMEKMEVRGLLPRLRAERYAQQWRAGKTHDQVTHVILGEDFLAYYYLSTGRRATWAFYQIEEEN
jgi:hypothetical protein